MKAEVGNGPVGEEEENMEEGGEAEEEEEDIGDVEEFLKLDAELDALSSALDTLEQRNDSINSRLRLILEENRCTREAAAAAAVAEAEEMKGKKMQ
ncbi:UPF0184 protein AAEL002161-like isoform X1 [Portunus trituberculatus]|uniref:UPF0184 protein AAEL002161-like isoform X1 n=1 Tax=Portunus trituberculatus TaxID=210409 RepID=UPI001E1D0DC1|nr:UPF0184 protein AAEL002161-like isoform X1 [Portunus trituberculatus]